ncbi:helix-turn-helix domain-containing protein [Bdellovibrio sp.]|uniref:helix-turn-helix domain-containing protein n=1 Tax=Bdellovibrio sp. TaxID=28201 RepID=UPI0039E5FEAE
MLGTYAQLNSEALKLRLKDQDITQAELAERLEVNIKTVQRWVNGHVTKVKTETAQKMSEILKCSLEEIIFPEKTVRVLVKNKVLEQLFSKDIVRALHSTKRWDSYLSILKEFENSPLPTEQEAQLFMHIGYIKYQLGLYRSSKRYLNKALEAAEAVQNVRMIVHVLCYQSSNFLMLGEVDEAVSALEKALKLSEDASQTALLSEILYRKSKIYLTKNDFVTANTLLRQSIALELRATQSARRGLALKYIQLARLEIRRKNFSLARKYYRRAEMHARRSNFRITEAVAHYGHALTALLFNDNVLAQKHLRRARQLVGGRAEIQKNQKLLQIEFMFALHDKNYALCQKILQLRYSLNRRSKLLVVNTVKMALLLERVSKKAYPVRESWILTAKKYLKVLANNINQEQFRKLSRSPNIPLDHFEDLLDYVIL